MAKIKSDQIWLSIIVIASLGLLWISKSLKMGATYPRAMLILIIALSIISFMLSVRGSKANPNKSSEEGKSGETEPTWKDLAVLGVSPFVYLYLWDVLGFIITTVLFLYGLFLYKKYSPVKGLVVAIVTTVIIQYIFGSLFEVPLPSPDWMPRL